MKPQTILAISILIMGAALAQAQTGIWVGVGPVPRAGTIKDAPFSADLISTNDQVDGAPGTKTEFHGKVARDSQGDSYFAMEHVMPSSDGPRPIRITITNPAALTVTTLDPQSKTAFISHVSASMLNTARTLTPGSSSALPDGRPAGAVTDNAATTESLGAKEMNGLHVVGARTTRTVPTSTPGGKPYVSTVETWTSPELKIIVMMQMQTSNGDRHVTRLENIVRTEPSADLFHVPSGYTVRDNMPVASNLH